MENRFFEKQEIIVGRLWMAFARGAGDTPVSRAAVAELHERFGNGLATRPRLWGRSSTTFLELARQVGKDAAAAAVASGSSHIEVEHLDSALPKVMMECPCAPARMARKTA
jgi:hypothetical protein